MGKLRMTGALPLCPLQFHDVVLMQEGTFILYSHMPILLLKDQSLITINISISVRGEAWFFESLIFFYIRWGGVGDNASYSEVNKWMTHYQTGQNGEKSRLGDSNEGIIQTGIRILYTQFRQKLTQPAGF
jgi:hypothetical protein